ncbi:hypothetical protein OC834_007293, partial [Tilletia horrida]
VIIPGGPRDVPGYNLIDQPRPRQYKSRTPDLGTMTKDSASSSNPAQPTSASTSGAAASGTSEPFTLDSLGRLLVENNAQLKAMQSSVETRLSHHDAALTKMEDRLAALEQRTVSDAAGPAVDDAAEPRVVSVPHLRDHAPLPVRGATSDVRTSQPSLADMTRARQDGRHLQDRSRERANSGAGVRFVDPSPGVLSVSSVDGPGREPAFDLVGPIVPDDKFILCKAESLGEFRGDPFDLEFFIQQVEDRARALQGRNWAKAVRAAIPEALKGVAREWHLSLSPAEVAALRTVDEYLGALRKAFPVDRVQLRRDAHDRVWQPREETATAYTFPKVRMLRQAYGAGVPEQLLVDETMAGLEASMRALVRMPRDAYTVAALREELTTLERSWRDIHKVSLDARGLDAQASATPPPSKTASAAALPPSSATSRVAMTASAGAPASSTRGRYDPSRVVEAKGSEPRMYRRDNGSYMRLGRPCGRCGEQHFDFEHAYLKEGARAFPMVPDSDDDFELVEHVAVPASDF